MSNKETGGFAFPGFQIHEGTTTIYGGMTLRDWFAGQALAGICGDGIPGRHHSPENTAQGAYGYADAMLKEREKGVREIPDEDLQRLADSVLKEREK